LKNSILKKKCFSWTNEQQSIVHKQKNRKLKPDGERKIEREIERERQRESERERERERDIQRRKIMLMGSNRPRLNKP